MQYLRLSAGFIVITSKGVVVLAVVVVVVVIVIVIVVAVIVGRYSTAVRRDERVRCAVRFVADAAAPAANLPARRLGVAHLVPVHLALRQRRFDTGGAHRRAVRRVVGGDLHAQRWQRTR